MKKIVFLFLGIFFIFNSFAILSSAKTYNYDFWRNVVPSAEGLSYKDTYYGKDILFGGEKQKVYQGVQEDQTTFSATQMVWKRKETVSMPYQKWDVNQWEYLDNEDWHDVKTHQMVTSKEIIRTPPTTSIVIPNGKTNLNQVKKDAYDELSIFLENELGYFERFSEILKEYFTSYLSEVNSLIQDATSISELEAILTDEKLFLQAIIPILEDYPKTLSEVKEKASNALLDAIGGFQYTEDNELRVNEIITSYSNAMELSNEVNEILVYFYQGYEEILDVLILVDVVAKDLLISEYGEGENNDYLEIYNGTSEIIDLSLYALEIFPDSIKEDEEVLISLSGELSPGETYLIVNPLADDALKALADLLWEGCSFDGNDAIALMRGEDLEILDLFGILQSNSCLNAKTGEDSVSYEDLKVYQDKIYLLDAKHLLKEKVIMNDLEVTLQGRSQIIILNQEMKWERVVSEFEITEHVKEKLDDFYQFDIPLSEITPDRITSNDLTKRAPYVPLSTDSSKAAIHLYGAKGIMVTDAGIYVADTKNSRVLKMNFDFVVEEVYLTPSDPTFYQYDGKESLSETLRTVFHPLKIAVDRTQRVYVIAEGVYEGIMEYSPLGKFNRFLGKNEVVANPLKLFWAKIFSDEQLKAIELDLPPEFTNITIDKAGFLYTTSKPDPDDPTASKMIKAINTAGKDVLKRNGYVPPDGDAVYVGFSNVTGAMIGPSIFSGITINKIGNFTAVDSKRGRLFTYDSEGNLLYISGEKGELSNSINDPVSVSYYSNQDSDKELVLVLDRASKSIISFATTAFGELVNKATELYLKNDIEEAEQYWREVIKMNSNYELGYIGIGKSLLRRGEYEEAMAYFKLGHNSSYYSKAFQLYRDNFLKENFNYIMTSFIVLMVSCFCFIYSRRKKQYKKVKKL